MTEEQDEKRITLRVPADIYKGIVSAAQDKHLSINSYILQVLSDKQYLADLEMRMATIERQIAELQMEKRRLQ